MVKTKVIECPRDAMQGLSRFISTDDKVDYINQLLRVGFDVLDVGSFVSPKAIPQMADTGEVLAKIQWANYETELLVIVANERGAETACRYPQIKYIGYPFSVSETFQVRNTNATIEESINRLKRIKSLADDCGKSVVVYISMAFGNPYGDPWNAEIVMRWTNYLCDMDIRQISLSDTIGVAEPSSIDYLFSKLIPSLADIEIGAHFHTTPTTWREKIETAWEAGCRRFDGALLGYGGCPMAKDELTGNMPTEHLIGFLNEKEADITVSSAELHKAMLLATRIFHG